ncbi:MAG: alpha/beta-hydrolase family protein [Rhodococcus sp. (in: high G+C Gram-positive bacteria)]
MSAEILDAPVILGPPTTRSARPAVPRTATSIILSMTVIASLAPGLLPRSSLTQALVTGIAAALGLALSTIAHRIVSRVFIPSVRPVARRIALCGSVTAIFAAAVSEAGWQNDLRSAMGTEPTPPMHWVEVWCGAISICAISVVIGVGLRRGGRRLGRTRTVCVILVTGLAGYLVVLPAVWASLTDRFAASNAMIDSSLTIPLTPSKSGSIGSLVGWDDLGREGRKFVSGGTDADAVRTYVALDAASSATARAQIAVDELEPSGGLTKSHLVVAVPTGSGWVDENATSGIEDRFQGDVATVALQYSYRPSWATFLLARTEAEDSATALLDAVRTRIAALPAASRPDLYIYGQSLGAIGGSAAVAANPEGICGTLWAGPPAGEVESGSAVVLANTSDPVVRWSTELLTSPPKLDDTQADAPMPQWIPVVSYLQTTVDLMSALNAPIGHGHRYGADQGSLLPEC